MDMEEDADAEKVKFSKTEKLAFEMGQRERIQSVVASNKDSKVFDAYCKGFNGFENTNKPLF